MEKHGPWIVKRGKLALARSRSVNILQSISLFLVVFFLLINLSYSEDGYKLNTTIIGKPLDSVTVWIKSVNDMTRIKESHAPEEFQSGKSIFTFNGIRKGEYIIGIDPEFDSWDTVCIYTQKIFIDSDKNIQIEIPDKILEIELIFKNIEIPYKNKEKNFIIARVERMDGSITNPYYRQWYFADYIGKKWKGVLGNLYEGIYKFTIFRERDSEKSKGEYIDVISKIVPITDNTLNKGKIIITIDALDTASNVNIQTSIPDRVLQIILALENNKTYTNKNLNKVIAVDIKNIDKGSINQAKICYFLYLHNGKWEGFLHRIEKGTYDFTFTLKNSDKDKGYDNFSKDVIIDENVLKSGKLPITLNTVGLGKTRRPEPEDPNLEPRT
ncbi:MAG: hypothetical protein UT30_C0032G0009 [Candidatus Uhrbacteria bacterium GW2011_GWF2_39_13]|uniref:Uncharacterized protein n=1 Tax=Candidatus Uhrbacteria bacterium GW2011_GWF2_39_13 TaxID=1618995 RepID=A0A0G0PYV4_9BACT|nr:MAG: hypothetical protein UT30_C0032G0009 [Candidatus Uhrbacteria bacterium GW2011_GWF2_39_13]